MARFKITADIPAWLQAIRDKEKPVAEAAVMALRETAANAVQQGRKDIAAAGRFGIKWQQGLQYRTKGASEGGAASLNATATIFHRYGIAEVFEYGATISGKPLLWIPTTPGAPPPKKSGKKLVSVNIAGKPPMLFDAADRDRHKKPLYVGVKQVRIAQKFHIRDIVKENMKHMGELFIKDFKE
jgi:hypothetical protein